MRILTWNCNGALRKKFEKLHDFHADILIIQECENPESSKDLEYRKWAENYLWIGDNKNKGLGVFGKSGVTLQILDWSNLYQDKPVKYFLPCRVNNSFNLLAVWTHYNYSPTFKYIGQFWKYLQINKDNFRDILICGDFNSNRRWDEWDRWWNHTDVVKELKGLEIESLYHLFMSEEQGSESIPTFYLQRNLHKPYHIDYCFGSSEFFKNLKSITIEPFENWKHFSDHCPIIVEI